MRPVSVAVPPYKADGLAYQLSGSGLVLSWNDNSINETEFVVQRDSGMSNWVTLGSVPSPLDQPNLHGVRSFTDSTYQPNGGTTAYRVVAINSVGYGGDYMSLNVQSVSDSLIVGNLPLAPTNLSTVIVSGPRVRLTWRDNATNESGFVVERSVNGGAFVQISSEPPRVNTGNTTIFDFNPPMGATLVYRVAAFNAAGNSAFSNTSTVTLPTPPAAPGSLTIVNAANGGGNNRRVTLTWTDLSTDETGFTIQRALNAAFTYGFNSVTVPANTTSLTQTNLVPSTQYYYRIRSVNGTILFSGWINGSPFPITTNP